MSKETKIGAIFILCIIALFIFAPSVQTRDSKVLSRKYNLIFVKAPNIQEGTDVKMAGVDIGEVESINFCSEADKKRFGEDSFLIINIAADYDTYIPEDSSACVISESMHSWLEITPGISSKNLENGCTVRLNEPYSGSLDLSSIKLNSLYSFKKSFSDVKDMLISPDAKTKFWDMASNARFYSNELRILSGSADYQVSEISNKLREKAEEAEIQLSRIDVQLLQTKSRLSEVSEALKNKTAGWEAKSEAACRSINGLTEIAADETERFKNISLAAENKTESICTPQMQEKLHKYSKKLKNYAQIAEDLRYMTQEPETQEALKQMVHRYREQSDSINDALKKFDKIIPIETSEKQ